MKSANAAEAQATGPKKMKTELMIENSDIILLIHDGESRGTRNEMLRTIKFGKPYVYERIPVKV